MGGHKELDTTKREHKRTALMLQPAQAPRLAELEGRFLFFLPFFGCVGCGILIPTKDPTHTSCSGRKFRLLISGSPGKLKEVSDPVSIPLYYRRQNHGPKRQDD